MEKNRIMLRSMQEVIYDRYVEMIYAKCITMAQNKETAKDLTHDIIIKILINLHSYRSEASFKSWIISITYHHCLNYFRKEKQFGMEELEANESKLAANELDLENKILLDLQLSQLEKLIKQIRANYRMILLMYYQDGMSIKQIAKVLNIGESAAKMRLKRSRDQLAILFKASSYGPGKQR